MTEENNIVYVTTDADYWNSADSAYFFLNKGQVKPLPDEITPIIENAMEQGLLREATTEELKAYKFSLDVERAVINRLIKSGKNYQGTVDNYNEYLENQEAKKIEEPKVSKPEVEEPKDEKPKDEKPVVEDHKKEIKETEQ